MNWATFATWVLQIFLVAVLLFVLSAAAVAVWDVITDRRRGGGAMAEKCGYHMDNDEYCQLGKGHTGDHQS